MALEAFVLRVFIYGLVGFAPSGRDAIVLVPADPDHKPFIGLAAKCVDSGGASIKCPEIKLPGVPKFSGYELEGYKIELGDLSEGDATSSPIEHVPVTDPKPTNADAKSFSWVPSMASILKNQNDAKIKSECLVGPEGCEPALKGWMKLTKGKFETCQFVRHWDIEGIYSYQFKDSDDEILWEQALADIVKLDVAQVRGAPVALRLSDFDGVEIHSIRLTPITCPDSPQEKCVDVFIGNMAPRNKANRHTRAEHFHRFYEFLAKNKKDGPHVVKNHGTIADDEVQPLCREVPPEFAISRLRRWIGRMRRGPRDFSLASFSPESRPICPMVIYSQ